MRLGKPFWVGHIIFHIAPYSTYQSRHNCFPPWLDGCGTSVVQTATSGMHSAEQWLDNGGRSSPPILISAITVSRASIIDLLKKCLFPGLFFLVNDIFEFNFYLFLPLDCLNIDLYLNNFYLKVINSFCNFLYRL